MQIEELRWFSVLCETRHVGRAAEELGLSQPGLSRALARLEDALAVPESAPLAIDGTIQRFEFVFELCWKTMKALLERLPARAARDVSVQAKVRA